MISFTTVTATTAAIILSSALFKPTFAAQNKDKPDLRRALCSEYRSLTGWYNFKKPAGAQISHAQDLYELNRLYHMKNTFFTNYRKQYKALREKYINQVCDQIESYHLKDMGLSTSSTRDPLDQLIDRAVQNMNSLSKEIGSSSTGGSDHQWKLLNMVFTIYKRLYRLRFIEVGPQTSAEARRVWSSETSAVRYACQRYPETAEKTA